MGAVGAKVLEWAQSMVVDLVGGHRKRKASDAEDADELWRGVRRLCTHLAKAHSIHLEGPPPSRYNRESPEAREERVGRWRRQVITARENAAATAKALRMQAECLRSGPAREGMQQVLEVATRFHEAGTSAGLVEHYVEQRARRILGALKREESPPGPCVGFEDVVERVKNPRALFQPDSGARDDRVSGEGASVPPEGEDQRDAGGEPNPDDVVGV